MAEAERSILGLTHNPFVEPSQGFFDRGGRKTQLEQLRHLSEWSRRVLLVTGPEGVGKTTLYRELAATLEPRVKAARIHAGLVNTGREVLAAIAQGFGIAVAPDANLQNLQHEIIAHVTLQSHDADRTCLALVDDAHLLDNKAVDELVGLAQKSSLHLVLFGEVRMVPAIERVASSNGVGWQELRLTGYGEADARDYLEWRFQQAKYRGRVPFADSEVRDLIRLSEGLPGRMNQMANVLLVKLESGETEARNGGFPKAHAALLALLLAVMALLYVLFADPIASPEQETMLADRRPPVADPGAASVDDTAAEPAGEPEEAAEGSAEASETPLQVPETALPTAGDTAGETAAGTDTVAAAWEADPVDAQGVEADGTDAAGPPMSDAGATAADRAVLAGNRSGIEDAAEAVPRQVPSSETATDVPGFSGGGTATPSAAEQDPSVVAEAAAPPAPATEPPAEEREAPPAAAAADEAAVAAPAGVRDGRWLLAQNPDYFTLQLITVSAAERAAAFVARQSDPREFAIYQLQRDGRRLHVVLYGLFSSRAAAERAAANLPPGLNDVQPWIRPLDQVQASARTTLLQ